MVSTWPRSSIVLILAPAKKPQTEGIIFLKRAFLPGSTVKFPKRCSFDSKNILC
uniref:Uncharacterized protein n=1 Tax=Meloidogyne enterolobii TaxID=390850 RepID=A0A6V7WBY1_MELEN|nr:unnamed protein product [Meloidogyne enterolobii]